MVNPRVVVVFATRGRIFLKTFTVPNFLNFFFDISSFRSTVRLQAHEAEHLVEAGEGAAIPNEEVESYLVISMEN